MKKMAFLGALAHLAVAPAQNMAVKKNIAQPSVRYDYDTPYPYRQIDPVLSPRGNAYKKRSSRKVRTSSPASHRYKAFCKREKNRKAKGR